MNIKNIKVFKNKVILILIGILLAFICLEIFLQATSFVITQVIKYNNHKQIENKFNNSEKITVLCIGESTTFRQYPIQLREYLKKHSNKNFEIIDLGRPGAMLPYISAKLENDIEKYKPDIIITMMGINQASYVENKNERVYEKYKLKTIELMCLVVKHLKISLSKGSYMEDMQYANYTDTKNKIIKLIDEFYEYNNNSKTLNKFDEDIEQSIAFVQTILDDVDSNNIDKINCYVDALELIIKYWKSKEYPTELFEMLKKDIDVEINEYIIYALFSFCKKKYDFTEDVFKELINILKDCRDRNKIQIYFDGTIYKIMDLDLSSYKNYVVQLYDLFWQNNVNGIENFYLYLKENNIDVIKPQQSEIVVDVENDIEENNRTITMNEEYINNYYLKIAEKILSKDVIYMCMGYPTMPINELKYFFKDTIYYDRMIFVSNEENFNKALKKYSYDELFWDRFAGSFGHCTDLGNTIIAENLGKAIIDITNK